jgi:hypothetical protein
MKKANVVELSRQVSEAQMAYDTLGMMNTPTDPVKRVEMDAAFRMTSDRLESAKYAYRQAFNAWMDAGQPE